MQRNPYIEVSDTTKDAQRIDVGSQKNEIFFERYETKEIFFWPLFITAMKLLLRRSVPRMKRRAVLFNVV